MNSLEIKELLRKKAYAYNHIFIPEFTWENLRIDALLLDTGHKWIRGYEIKTKRIDFQRDQKWTEYSQFCSSLCIVCPESLIDKKEIKAPFGLIWIIKSDNYSGFWNEKDKCYYDVIYKKKPKNFQKRNSLSWLWTYNNVLTLEIRRLYFENEQIKSIPKIKEILQKEVE